MNRQQDFTQGNIKNTIYDQPRLLLTKIDDHKIKISPEEVDSGWEILLVPYTTKSGLVTPVDYPPYIIDFDSVGVNSTAFTGGRLDGMDTITSDDYYLIWSLSDVYYNQKGFGITAIPKSVYTTTSASAKGDVITLTGIGKAYRYTIGCRVRVIEDDTVGSEKWNLGTVTEILSSTSIKVLTDNDLDYGTPLTATTGVSVEQLDKFKPYLPNDSQQRTYTDNYRIIGIVELLDDTGYPIRRVYKYPVNHYTYPQKRTIFYRSGIMGAFAGTIDICKLFLPEYIKKINLTLYVSAPNLITSLQITSPINAAVYAKVVPVGINQINFVLDESCKIDYQGTMHSSSVVTISILGWER